MKEPMQSYRFARCVRACGFSCLLPEEMPGEACSVRAFVSGAGQCGDFTVSREPCFQCFTVRCRSCRRRTVLVLGTFSGPFSMLADWQCALSIRVSSMTVRHRLRRVHAARPPVQRKRVQYEEHPGFWRFR